MLEKAHIRLEVVTLGLASVFHAVVGLVLLPHWMFAKYPDFARLLRAEQLGSEEAGDVSPLYLLANLVSTPEALRVMQSLVGTACVPLAFKAGAALFGRRAGFASAFLIAAAGPLFVYEATLEPDLFIAALGLATLALLASARTDLRTGLLVGAGVTVGLLVAFRPTNLGALAVLGLWVAWVARKLGTGTAKALAALVGTALLTAAVPLAGVRVAAGSQLGATMSVGEMIHICNRPEGTGLGSQFPLLIAMQQMQIAAPNRPDPVHALYRRFARAAEGPELTPLACEGFWMRKAAHFAISEPAALVSLWLRKLVFFLAGPDAYDVAETREAARQLGAFHLPPLRLFSILGFAGLVLCALRRKSPSLAGIDLLPALGVSIVFCVTSRYCLTAFPSWTLLAGFWVTSALEAATGILRPSNDAGGTTWKTPAFCVLTLAIPLALAGLPFVRSATEMANRGAMAAARMVPVRRDTARADFASASLAYRAAAAAQPFVTLSADLRGIPFEDPALNAEAAQESEVEFGGRSGAGAYLHAVLLDRAGQCDKARSDLEASAAANFRSAIFDVSLDPRLLIAECDLQRGDRSRALVEIRRSLSSRPGTLQGLAEGVAGAEALGDVAQAKTWRAELFQLHDPLSARLALARARRTWGDAQRALSDVEAVTLALPDSAIAAYEGALTLLALGRTADALVAYRKALVLFPRHAFGVAPFHAAVESRAASANPPDPELVVEQALREGQPRKAGDLAAKAMTSGQGSPELQTVVHWLAGATTGSVTDGDTAARSHETAP